MKDFQGKVALVTGGAVGFGRAIETLLLDKGCKVAILDLDVEQGRRTEAEFQNKYGKECCVFYKCDVTDDQEFEDCFVRTRAKFGGLDIVINNAGVAGEAKWKKIFAINTGVLSGPSAVKRTGNIGAMHTESSNFHRMCTEQVAAFCGTLLGLKYMGKDNGHKGGHIINVASRAGLQIQTAIPAYNASKFAVVAMTRSFGTDLHYKRHGVKVNCICPEPMNTPMWWGISEFCKTKNDTVQFAQGYENRVQRVEDVAQGVLKLLEDEKNGTALAAFHGHDLEYYQFQE